ncbi:hypothetical protein DS2_02470 [Catenovulum agarivorans DS-2]|uniref:Sulfotransferase family protein n=1 Tax=Catenovulum agarivorans DS-2 TaxID=1328313 RepID=W7QVB7_9ALTE|nr:sulfotransferase [Catenovulum agarivorans]EWH11653.1 hypothetical protein DS2_02470 [Catenovulum agarivorans DS-2]
MSIDSNLSQAKVFVVGLPRTATTSLCVAMLELGFKTAHTAFTQDAFTQAQVIADAPIFADFVKLSQVYPEAKFIYLQRELSAWLPSIQQLLRRMHKNIVRPDGGFNPHLKRVYQQVFQPFNIKNIDDVMFLAQCYQQHQLNVEAWFSNQPSRLLKLDVANPGSFDALVEFLQQHQLLPMNQLISNKAFKPINIAGKVTAWQQISHPNKVESTRFGKVDKLAFLTDDLR